MPESWQRVRAEVRQRLLDPDGLVRAVAAGRRKGRELRWRRVELRPVRLTSGVRLQVITYDERTAHTANHIPVDAATVVDELLDEPFGNWHLECADEVIQVRITKKGDAQVHRERRDRQVASGPSPHDQVKTRLFDPGQPEVRAFLGAVGIADHEGRIKPTRRDKYQIGRAHV